MKFIKAYFNLLLLVLLVPTLSSCGLTKVYIKNYEGEKKPSNEISLIKPVIYTVIKSINGDESKAFTPWRSFGLVDAEIAVTPGPIEMEIGYENLNLKSEGSIKLVYYIEPGKRYLISYNRYGYGKWKPEIIDVTNKPERWCVHGANCL